FPSCTPDTRTVPASGLDGAQCDPRERVVAAQTGEGRPTVQQFVLRKNPIGCEKVRSRQVAIAQRALRRTLIRAGIGFAHCRPMPCRGVCDPVRLGSQTQPLLRLRARPLRIALVGNPNVGKSVLFHRLTGRYATVSNYPGTTVALTKGRALVGAEVSDVIDTPGVNLLEGPLSEDERVTRDVLRHGDADLVGQQAGTR